VVSIDIAAVILRLALGWTMFAHGYNHVWGGGKLPGTARWFGSIGFRHSQFQALMASVTELVVGPMLVLGLLTPLACIFRPGEGYEYVLMVACVSIALGALGGGRVSLDNAIGFDVDGWGGLALTALAGGGGAAAVLLSSWRPERTKTG